MFKELFAEFSDARGSRHRHIRGVETTSAIQGEGKVDQLSSELVELFQEAVGFDAHVHGFRLTVRRSLLRVGC